MWDVAKVVLGAILAMGTGFFTQLFVMKQKELTDRVDELVKLIWDYADLSSKYWNGEFNPTAIGSVEAKIVAVDHFIGSTLSSFPAVSTRFEMQPDLERALTVLSISTTGGNFQVIGRKNDPARAAQIYTNASQLCVLLRTERKKLMRLFRLPSL